jgi:omega-6 fatty acid desaturase (delta-12 desaturase)
MTQAGQQDYPELNSYINNFIKPNDTKAWIAILISLGYELLAVALIHLNLSMLGWIIHTLNIVRLFIQFHDMAHFSYFTSLRMNKLAGHVIGVYVHFPFDMWRDGHNFHHKHFGNLDKVDLSQTILFTKKQYESWPLSKRILVRVFREPVVFFFFTIQALWLFGILANCIKRYGLFSASVMEKILGVIVYVWVFDWLGLPALKMALSLYAAQAIGTIMFHLQHSVNVPYREHK